MFWRIEKVFKSKIIKNTMIVKILGGIDIFIGAVFLLSGIFNIAFGSFMIILGLFLLIKGLIFIGGLSVISFLDIISGGLIILSVSVTMPLIIVSIVALFLIQKGVFSLL